MPEGRPDAEVAEVLKRHPDALVLSASSLPGRVKVRGYTNDGAQLFQPSLRAFDLPAWLRSGTVRSRRAIPRTVR